MAKKYQQRTHVDQRMQKEKEQKQQKNQEFVKKHKKLLKALGVALVILIVAAIFAADYFGSDQGSMRVFLGKVQNVEKNTVVGNLGTNNDPLYYTLAWYTPNEGYSPVAISLSSDSNEQWLQYDADDENALIQSAILSSVRQRTAEGQASYLYSSRSLANYASITEGKAAEIAGHQVYYNYATTLDSSDPSMAYATLLIYKDTIRDSCVGVRLASRMVQRNQLPTEAMMLLAAEEFMSHLETLPKEN